MHTNLFRARLDAAFLLPAFWVGDNPVYRPDAPVDLEDLLLGTVDGEEEWRRVERLGAGYLYRRVLTAEVPLTLFIWSEALAPVYGSLYLAEFGLRKTFLVMRGRIGPNALRAAFRGCAHAPMISACVNSLLSRGAEWYGEELFDELPARTINRRPDLLSKETLLAAYCAFAERVLGESERALVETYFATTYSEDPVEAPAQSRPC